MAYLKYAALFLLCCFSASNALLQSSREASVFAPSVPRYYHHNINGTSVSALQLSSRVASEDPLELAVDFARQLVGDDVQHIIKSAYTTKHNKVHHTYLRQTIGGLEIFNADLNINIWNKQVLSAGHSFFLAKTPAPARGVISAVQAAVAFAKHIGIDVSHAQLNATVGASEHSLTIVGFPKVESVRAQLGFMMLDGGLKLESVWELEVDTYDNWFDAFVSTVDMRVVAVYDWVSDLESFQVYPPGVNDPQDGNRVIESHPDREKPSPYGWNSQGTVNFTDTRGNNVYAQENWSGGSAWQNNQRPKGGIDLDFIFPIDFTRPPREYINASTTNLFYWNNFIHDLFYEYGFDEVAGNFQENNFGRGGAGVDAVQANCQDGSGTNNANFATPVDGQRPRMRMYIWTTATPNRDGDLENGIIIHEYAHGISNRLTGGPNNVNCLGSGEAGGMGEGWGDFFATALRMRESYSRNDNFPMGAYSANNPNGIRKFNYSTSMTVNPETYDYLNRAGYEGVHAKGEVWANMLYEVYWNYVDYWGFNPNWYQRGTAGNQKILQDVVDGMKLQPCVPNFVSARDAILQADKINNNGQNVCLLWNGFAKRGLGLKAVGTSVGVTKVVQDFTTPDACIDYKL